MRGEMSVKKHTLVFKERSVDWPPEVVKKWGGEILVLPDGRRAVRWPVINVDSVGAIPADCPCPMGVPITIFDKMDFRPGNDFELVGHMGDGRVNGELKFKRVIIRNRALRERLLGVRSASAEA